MTQPSHTPCIWWSRRRTHHPRQCREVRSLPPACQRQYQPPKPPHQHRHRHQRSPPPARHPQHHLNQTHTTPLTLQLPTPRWPLPTPCTMPHSPPTNTQPTRAPRHYQTTSSSPPCHSSWCVPHVNFIPRTTTTALQVTQPQAVLVLPLPPPQPGAPQQQAPWPVNLPMLPQGDMAAVHLGYLPLVGAHGWADMQARPPNPPLPQQLDAQQRGFLFGRFMRQGVHIQGSCVCVCVFTGD